MIRTFRNRLRSDLRSRRLRGHSPVQLQGGFEGVQTKRILGSVAGRRNARRTQGWDGNSMLEGISFQCDLPPQPRRRSQNARRSVIRQERKAVR